MREQAPVGEIDQYNTENMQKKLLYSLPSALKCIEQLTYSYDIYVLSFYSIQK